MIFYNKGRFYLLRIALFFVLPVLLLSLNLKLNAQDFASPKPKPTDVELWSGLAFGKEITKEVDLSFAYQLRYNENLTRFKSTFVQFGFDFSLKRIHKDLKAGPSIRLARDFDKEFNKRLLFDLSMPVYKTKQVRLTYKVKFQKDFNHFTVEEFDFDFYCRNRVTANFKVFESIAKLVDFVPYLDATLFTRAWYKGSKFDQIRLSAGINYKIKKRQSIRLGYTYRERFNISVPSKSHIITFKINFEIKDFKKKKDADKEKKHKAKK